jgi:RNA polymerase sigma factor (sigma-70 family)
MSVDGFAALVAAASDGSDEAARRLWDEYGPHVVRVVRRRLAREMRPMFDSLDFAQAVWGSLFADRGRLRELRTPQRLTGYLTHMARNKVVEEFRRQVCTQKRQAGRTLSLDDSTMPLREALAAREATPSQEAIGQERWEQLTADRSWRQQEIVRLRRDGLTLAEVAETLGVNERTVRRVLQRLQQERPRR